MHFPGKLALALAGWAVSIPTFALASATFHYHIAGDDPGPWPQIFSSIGITRAAGGPANVFVVRTVAAGSVPQWLQRIEQGGIVVLEGEGELSAALGITPGKQRVAVRSIVDRHAPKLPIVWESPSSGGTMRRLRWLCIVAWVRCYGWPRRPAKKGTNGSLICYRPFTILE